MWRICFVLTNLCVLSATRPSQIVTAGSPDDTAPTPDIASHHGYRCETHRVTTEDGYILQVHRLPGGRTTALNSSLAPVLLQHGLLDSSADWLVSGPDKALGYLLADQGYDVWMGNARGNIYSKAHTTLQPDNPKFWDWTWDEMGRYDLPAVIDHVLNVTGHRQILYVGHSMGTTMFFVLCSSRPEYNAKVRYMAALAPVAYMGHATSPLHYLAPFAQSFEKIIDFFGDGEFLPRDAWINFIFRYTCESFRFEERICENYLFLICGHDPEQFVENLLPIILGHVPAGTSTKTVVHYAQEVKSNQFQRFDYGAEKNIVLYNSTEPPKYNLSQITVPISLHYGDNDLLANPLDVATLFSELKSSLGMFRVNLSSFNHLDFLWGRDAKTLVYSTVQSLMGEYGVTNPSTARVTDREAELSASRRAYILSLNTPSAVSNLRFLTRVLPDWMNSVLPTLQTFSDNLVIVSDNVINVVIVINNNK